MLLICYELLQLRSLPQPVVFPRIAEDFPETLMELERRFSDEAACRGYLFALRWPQGFTCPRCQGQSAGPMTGARWLCAGCRGQVSVTAWTVLPKLRRAMVRPGRERLHGLVEVDEAYWDSEEDGVRGRQTYDKALSAIATEADGEGLGRIRLRHIPDTSRVTLHGFMAETIEPGSTVPTDGLQADRELSGYVHDRRVQKHQPEDAAHLLPQAHRVISLLKRWLLGTHQGAGGADYLQDYLDEFTFRFNRRSSASRGKLFDRLAQQAVQVVPPTYNALGDHNP